MKHLLLALALAACGGSKPATNTAEKTADTATVTCGDRTCTAAEFCVHLTSSGHGQESVRDQPPVIGEKYACKASAPASWEDTGIQCNPPTDHKVDCISPLAPAAPPR